MHLEMLQQQRVDAIIQLGGRADDLVSNGEYVEKVKQIIPNIPLVVTGKLDGTPSYEVQIDAKRAVRLLMDYLLGLGHERIAMVGGGKDVLATFNKAQEYREILKEHHIPYREEYVIEGSYNYETGYFCMNQVLELDDIPTALIPKLTSIDYDYVTFGRKLVETAIAVAQGRKVPRHQKVTPALMIRESSGPAPGGA